MIAVSLGRDAWRRTFSGLGPWVYLAPALLLFGVFKFVPVLKGLEMSFYKVQFGGTNEWVGLGNFERVLNDAGLRDASLHTLVYVLVTVSLSAVIALLMALAEIERQVEHGFRRLERQIERL